MAFTAQSSRRASNLLPRRPERAIIAPQPRESEECRLKMRAVVSNATLTRERRGTAMRFRGLLGALAILSALAVPAATSSAQGPAVPRAFDGKYVGTATLTQEPRWGGDCVTVTSVDMMITGEQVVTHEVFSNGPGLTYRASVNGAGEVSASFQALERTTNIIPCTFTISGTIHDNVYTSAPLCPPDIAKFPNPLEMRHYGPPPTTSRSMNASVTQDLAEMCECRRSAGEGRVGESGTHPTSLGIGISSVGLTVGHRPRPAAGRESG
jgi:hypothetical protein